MRLALTPCLLAVCGLITTTSPALAQTTQGALQLGLGTDPIGHTKWSGEWERPDRQRDSELKRTHWGFGENNHVFLEGGYGLTDALVVGGLLTLGGYAADKREDLDRRDADHYSSFEFSLAPKLDYLFLPESRVRPFLGAALGIIHHSENVEHSNAEGERRTRDDWSVTGLFLLLRAGIRAYVTPDFSLDPALLFGWLPVADGSRRMPDGPAGTGGRYDYSASSFTVGLGFTVSGWVGL